MVKKVVYPAKRKVTRTPYEFSENRAKSSPDGESGHEIRNGPSASMFIKLKNWITNPWSSKEQNRGSNGESKHVVSQGDGSSNVEPFRYPAPDSSIFKDISSRKRGAATFDTSFESSMDANSSTVAKQKLLKYLSEKGISELEAEGILSLAKHIEDDQQPSINQSTIFGEGQKKADYSFLTSPEKKKSESPVIENNKKVNKEPPQPSIFDLSNSNISRVNMTQSLANSTSMLANSSNTSMKRIYRYTEMPSPFKINLTKRRAAGNTANILDSVNNGLENTTAGYITARDPDSTSDVSHVEKPNFSATAMTLLGILDSNEESEAKVEIKKSKLSDSSKTRGTPTRSRLRNKTNYEISINPYNASKAIKQILPASTASTPVKAANLPSNESKKDTDKSFSFLAASSSTPKQKEATKGSNGEAALKYKPSKSSSLRAEIKEQAEVQPIESGKEINQLEKDNTAKPAFNFGTIASKPDTNASPDLKKNIEVINVSDEEDNNDGENSQALTPVTNKTTDVTILTNKQGSPLVADSFERVFLFPTLLKQEYLINDVDEAKVEMFKSLFTFN